MCSLGDCHSFRDHFGGATAAITVYVIHNRLPGNGLEAVRQSIFVGLDLMGDIVQRHFFIDVISDVIYRGSHHFMFRTTISRNGCRQCVITAEYYQHLQEYSV